MIRISNTTIFGGGFQASSRVMLPQKPVLGQLASSGRVLEAKAGLDEAVRNREAVEHQLSSLEFLMGPEATAQALEEAETSVTREREMYNQVLTEERRP